MQVGQTISHYRITAPLGSGGMGLVYEAQDLTLGRRVALKFLPPEMANDTAAMERFQLEARAASALNHPNICTIYAVEREAGQFFIAMELLEGQSLDAKLASGPLPVDRLLDVGIQLADALDAAHAKGIIHRDIKPANIFLTPRGQVKVLDFGLAKLTRFAEPAMETVATLAGPGPAHLTSPGSTVGTIAYMSPEQASGEELDARTDLFSAGAVLYQAATGALPFAGKTPAVIFHAILQLHPAPPSQLNPSLPAKFEEIIAKALEKDRELRYQSAADLRGDLRRLKRDTDLSKSRSIAASSSRVGVDESDDLVSQSRVGTGLGPVLSERSSAETSPSSSVVAIARQSRLGFAMSALVLLGLLAAASYGIYAFLTRSKMPPFQNISIRKVTQSGKATRAAISPDGKYILNVVSDSGLESLWLRNLPTNSDTQVIPPAPVHYQSLCFSPDGNYLYFVRSEGENRELAYLYRAPLLGGTPQRLATDIDSNISFAPDGRQFAFIRDNDPEPGKYRLILQSPDGGGEKVLVSGPVADCMSGVAWSSDGKTIVCVAIQPSGALSGLTATDVSTSQQKLFFKSLGILSGPTWLPDGSGLLVLSLDVASSYTRNQIGFVSYPDGKYRSVTNDINNYSDLSITSDGRTLATVLNERHADLFLMPAAAAATASPRQLTSGEPIGSFAWTPGGQLIVAQDLAFNLLDPASGARTAIPTEERAADFDPSACADGRNVAFVLAGHAGKKTEIVARMDSNGRNVTPLTDGRLDDHPICARDGRWVYFLDETKGAKLIRVPIEGGETRQVSNLPVSNGFDVSPNAKLAAFATFQHVGDHKQTLALVPLDSGQPSTMIEFQRTPSGRLRFTNDNKAVVYPVRDHDVDNLWLQPLDGSPGRLITNFPSEHIANFAWSFDGSQLALIRGHVDSDVVLIRDSQP